MTTLAKRTANQRNAQHSTGPKTDAGKAVARLNAVAHGLRAASPVVPGEDPATWEAYLDAMLSDLAPVGVLETELADRVALLSWRLRRVSTFEAGAVTRNSDKAARKARGDDPADERLGISAPMPATPKNVQLVLDRVAEGKSVQSVEAESVESEELRCPEERSPCRSGSAKRAAKRIGRMTAAVPCRRDGPMRRRSRFQAG